MRLIADWLSDTAWTSQLLDSPLALDPMIGREAIRTVECFLDVRRAALPRASASTTAASGGGNGGESQDDFGMLDDLDFDDPALNAMLGIQGGGGGAPDSQQQREDELKAKDKAFAEVRLLSVAVRARPRLECSPRLSPARSGAPLDHRAGLLPPRLQHLCRPVWQRPDRRRPRQLRPNGGRVLDEVPRRRCREPGRGA